MTKPTKLARAACLVLALAAGACASRNAPLLSRQPGEGDQVQLTVENQNFKDATVYAVWGAGSRDRLGLVTGNTTQTFTVPWQGGDMRVEVDFIAGDDVFTEPIGTFRGDHIHVTIPPGA